MTDDNRESEVQDIADEDVMYEPLLDDDGGSRIEVETGSRDEL